MEGDPEGFSYSIYDGTHVEKEQINSIYYEEKQLLKSMVDQALSDLNSKELRSDAYNWIMDRGAERAFSFNFACAFLGLDPDYLRLGISNLLESGVRIKKGRRRTKT